MSFLSERRMRQLSMEGINAKLLDKKADQVIEILAMDGLTLRDGQYVVKALGRKLSEMERRDPSGKLNEIVAWKNKRETNMNELRFPDEEAAKRVTSVADRILIAIEESECTYREVIDMLKAIERNYMSKGYNFLDETSIQEVARHNCLLE